MQETLVQSLGQEDLWRREWLPTPIFLPGEFHGQRSLVTTVHGVAQSQIRLSDQHFHFTSLDGKNHVLFCSLNRVNHTVVRA